MPAQKPKAIRLKDSIPNNVRTPGKDDAAEYIQSEVLDKGRWPMDYSEMAEESGWSRQHLKNTIDAYFSEETAKNGDAELQANRFQIDVDVPADVDAESYIRGYIAARVE